MAPPFRLGSRRGPAFGQALPRARRGTRQPRMGKKCTGLVLGTVNITGAGSLVKLEPCARAADIWCVQEVKLEEDDTEGSVKFQSVFERWGFQAKIEPCITTDQGKSSGVAIAWKPWVRVRIPYTVFPGRVLAV